MHLTRIRFLPAIAALTVLSASAAVCSAQQIQSQPLPQIQAQQQPQRGAQAHKGATAPKAAAKQSGEGANAAEAQLRQRVEQLEEQLVDMQVVIGTLESLAKSATAAAPPATYRASPPGASGGADAARLEALETQVRALTAQMEQLSSQLRAASGRRADAGVPEREGANSRSRPEPYRPSGQIPGFGSITVTPGGGDDIGQLLAQEERNRGPQAGPAQAAFGEAGGPDQLYKTAYGYLLQQNYGAAEAAFDDFLKRYPTDAMAGNAQYWLGELYFVQGQYKQAAGAFLKGSRNYAKSVKAPDSLMKLAMSLDRMGQREAACQAFSELASRYPSPPAHLKERLQGERQKAGC